MPIELNFLENKIGELPVHIREYLLSLRDFTALLWERKDHAAGMPASLRDIGELPLMNGLYADILPERYERCFGNPEYAASLFGDSAQLLCVLYAEIRSAIPAVFDGDVFRLHVRVALLEKLVDICLAMAKEPDFYAAIKAPLQSAMASYLRGLDRDFQERRLKDRLIPGRNSVAGIAAGDFLTEEDRRTLAFLNELPKEEVESLAATWVRGFREGFAVTRRDLSKKKNVTMRAPLRFAPILAKAEEQLRSFGLTPIYARAPQSLFEGRSLSKQGIYGTNPNKQFDYDHKDDLALFLDEDFVERRLKNLERAYEELSDNAALLAGPMVLEAFGEKDFVPKQSPHAVQYDEEGRKLFNRLRAETSRITNKYIPQEETSFTIMALPVRSIGDDFEEIFRETVRVNTLDASRYSGIQQKLIDALDQAEYAHILGRGGNQTDLKVRLHPLEDPAAQTKFENCVADVNIPLGEVFTSPVLAGTEGLLHVGRVFLEGLEYKDLKIRIREGMVEDYSLANYPEEEENRRFFRENVLKHHNTLPMGEFAIGTNTYAYVMAERYGIADKLPILIAEKTGPHFAFGDTCYSQAEEVRVYNPDGKEIIAKENEVSCKWRDDPGEAYFHCHTDITIPFSELGSIIAVKADGEEIALIEEGRFVLPGTEELNLPLDEINELKEKEHGKDAETTADPAV